MNADAPPTLIVFDLGGVVVRICRSWAQACAAAGLPVRPIPETPEAQRARKALVRQYEVGQITCEEFFDAVSATTGGSYAPDEFRAIHLAWILDEYPGVDTLIDELHARGLATGVLSNTNHSHWLQLTTGPHGPAKFPTPQRVRHLHASHLLRHAKPDNAIYHAFAQRTGARPRDILFFDDLPDNIDGARAAGWRAHLIDHERSTAEQMREHLRAGGVM